MERIQSTHRPARRGQQKGHHKGGLSNNHFHQEAQIYAQWVIWLFFLSLFCQTEEEVGRQHQGMDRPGVRQVPGGSGEHGKMEETGCEIICGAPTTFMVKG